jgi:endonuclease YncB( thermonuclease family)
MRTKFLPPILLLFAMASGPSQGELDISDYKGWVITVLEGDTIRVLDGSNRMTRVRLKSIDAPERGQPYGEEARNYLASLLSGREIKVKANRVDGNGNILGQVWVAPPKCLDCKHSVDANLALLQAGLAWWSSKFAKQQSHSERKEYEAAEAKARQDRLGLWADPTPMPPWEWRQRRAAADTSARQVPE